MLKTLFKLSTIIVMLFVFTKSNYAQNHTHSSSISQNLQAPVRIAIDNKNNIYVTDASLRSIVKYDSSGNYQQTINQGILPLSIAINNENQMFVGVSDNGNIIKIDTSGTSSVFYTGCILPSSMVFGTDGLLYVVDSEQKMVIALDISANVVKSFGNDTLVFPSSIAYDSRNNRILVAEHGGAGGDVQKCGTGMLAAWGPAMRIHCFDLQGNLIESFSCHGNDDGEFDRIQGLTIGNCGNIYVCDNFQGNISVFDENLSFVTKFGQFGDTLGQLNVPMDIVFNSQGQIIVASMNNGALEVFTLNDTLPTSTITNSDASICIGDSTDITIYLTGTSPWALKYTRDGIDTVIVTNITANPYVFSVSDSGIYKVIELSDANYSGTCFSGSALINVGSTLPTSNIINGNIEICSGESAEIPIAFTGSSPWTFTYMLNGTNPTRISTANNPYILFTSDTGLYEVTAIEDVSCIGTSFTGTANVIVNPLPTSNITSENVSVCSDTTTNLSIEFTGTAPWSFTYTVNGLNPLTINTSDNPHIFTTSDSGIYEVVTISDAHCIGNINGGTPEVIVNPLPTVVMDKLTTTICVGQSINIPINFTGTNPWTFTYSINDTITTISNVYANPYPLRVDKEGIYQLESISDTNCVGTSFVSNTANISISPLPVAIFTCNPTGLQVAFLNNSLYADSYLWDFGDSTTSEATNPVHLYTEQGTYMVMLTASSLFCGDSIISYNINLLDVSDDENNELENIVKIYPNPSSGKITIEINNPTQSEMSLEIISVNGQVVFSNNLKEKKTIEQIDLSNYSSGMYTIKMTSEDLIKTAKLILYK